MAKQQPWIIKASGEKQQFSPDKLRMSLKRAGAAKQVIDEIVDHIEQELHDGMTTKEIYKHAFTLLKKNTRGVALKYSLRQAMLELGPSGFPFEQFLGELLKTQGYKVQVGGILQGKCVDHEVDVLAEKNDEHIFVEAKYHNQRGYKTDLKVALYVQARVDDITAAHVARAEKENRSPRHHVGWLVTNTKLTSKAIEYTKCSGLTVIGWNYPQEGNLQDRILEAGIHPLTCLTTLTEKQKRQLLTQGVVACISLRREPSVLRSIGLDDKKIDAVMKEVDFLCTVKP